MSELEPYYAAARQQAREAEKTQSLGDLELIIVEQEAPLSSFSQLILDGPGVSVIAEHKRSSPSEGEIRPGSSVKWTVQQYQQGGAVALSILTQQAHFGGSIEDIAEARKATDLPILRKDFISDEYQLYQAKAYGAAAALLIVAGLGMPQLQDLQEEARAIGLDCVVEVHDERELYQALEVVPNIIGINNRNLKTLQTDITTTERLIELVPRETVVIAESGYSLNNPQHMQQLKDMKVDGVLIGTSLMRQAKPAQRLAEWIDHVNPEL